MRLAPCPRCGGQLLHLDPDEDLTCLACGYEPNTRHLAAVPTSWRPELQAERDSEPRLLRFASRRGRPPAARYAGLDVPGADGAGAGGAAPMNTTSHTNEAATALLKAIQDVARLAYPQPCTYPLTPFSDLSCTWSKAGHEGLEGIVAGMEYEYFLASRGGDRQLTEAEALAVLRGEVLEPRMAGAFGRRDGRLDV